MQGTGIPATNKTWGHVDPIITFRPPPGCPHNQELVWLNDFEKLQDLTRKVRVELSTAEWIRPLIGLDDSSLFGSRWDGYIQRSIGWKQWFYCNWLLSIVCFLSGNLNVPSEEGH